MIRNQFAPIIIFAYNRPDKLNNLLESLSRNKELNGSSLYFYIDHYKNKDDLKRNQEVIEIAKGFDKANSISVITSNSNLGLKANILRGVNETFEKYNEGIFLEDDLVVSDYFLKYMNNSLNIYKDNKKIFHISGYNTPNFSGDIESSYFTYYMSCWGWATWKDRWDQNKNFQKNLISKQNKFKRAKFNIYGFEKDFESQLINNDKKLINTWAIYWSQFVFLSNAYCLNPVKSLVKNTGADSSGIHQGVTSAYEVDINNNEIKKFPKYVRFKIKNKLKTIYFYYKKNKSKKLNF